MSFNYPLADLVSRLNVSAKRRLSRVVVPYTDLAIRVLFVLYFNGVIGGFYVEDGFVFVYLKYRLGMSSFKRLSIVSRPGCRVF